MVELRGPGGKALISGALVVTLFAALFAFGFLGPLRVKTTGGPCEAPIQFQRDSGEEKVFFNFTTVEEGPWWLDRTRYIFESTDRTRADPPPRDTLLNASRRGEDARVYYRDLAGPDDRLDVRDMLVLNDQPDYELALEGADGRSSDVECI